MGINPEDLDTIAIPQLTEGQLSDLSLMVHSLPNGKMNKATLLALVAYLANKPLLNKIAAWSTIPAAIGTYRSYTIDGVEYLFRNLLEGNTSVPSLTSGGIPAWTRTNQQKEIPRWNYSPFIQPFQTGEFCYLPVNSNGTTYNWVWKSKIDNNDHNDPLDSGSDAYWEFIGENKFSYIPGTVYSANDVVVDTNDSNRTYVSNVNNNTGSLDQNLGNPWQLIGVKDPSNQITTLSNGLISESQIRQSADSSLSNAINQLAVDTEEAINSISAGQINAEIDVDPPDNISIANVSVAGTYPYYDGLIVTTEDLGAGLVQFRKLSGVWTKFIAPISLLAYVTKSDIVNDITTGGTNKPLSAEQGKILNLNDVIEWIPGLYGIGRKVTNKGSLYISLQATNSEPGVAAEDIWKKILYGVDFVSAFLNITLEVPLTAGQFYTPSTARAAVPIRFRKYGLVITYAINALTWVTEQFIDNSAGWATSDKNWKKIPDLKDIQYSRDVFSIVQKGIKYNGITGAGPSADAAYDCFVLPVTPSINYILSESVTFVIYYSGLPGAASFISSVTNVSSFVPPASCSYVVVLLSGKADQNLYKDFYVLPESDLSRKNKVALDASFYADAKIARSLADIIGIGKAYNFATGLPNYDSAFYDSAAFTCTANTKYILDLVAVGVVFYSGVPATTTFISSVTNVTEFTTPVNCRYAAVVFATKGAVSAYKLLFVLAENGIDYQNKIRTGSSDLTEVFNSISRLNKSLIKMCFAGDSLTANEIGGAIPLKFDEGDTMRPMRLLSNNFPRRMYDALSWNKPTWRRLDNAGWTKSNFTAFTETGMFEGTQEIYYKAETNGAYCEIVVPSGFENFALICRQKDGYGKLNVTLNGGSIGTYVNPYYTSKVATNTVVNSTVVPQNIPRGPSQIDQNKTGSSVVGNPYNIIEFKNLPAGANTLRFTTNSATRCDVWGGFYWTGNTMVAMNIGHGGHTTTDLITEHLIDELYDVNYDHIIFEVPEMNNQRLSLAQTQADMLSIMASLKGKDVVYTSCNMFGLSITYDVNMYTLYTNPNLKEVNDTVRTTVKSQSEAFIDIFDHFEKLVVARKGTLVSGEGGLWYTHDGQHGNIDGCREWFNVLYKNWTALHFRWNNRI